MRTLFTLLLLLLCTGIGRAAENEQGEKEKRREAEAAAEAQRNGEDSQRAPLMRGKVSLFNVANSEEPNVIGIFLSGNRRFKLEVAGKEVEADIRKYSTQDLALRGRIRDQGATFIAEAIEWGGPPPGLVRNPDGL